MFFFQLDSQQNYYSSSYGNYQITANKQYVTGYDQSAYPAASTPSATNTPVASSLGSNNSQTSFGSHPGYSYNQSTGEYQYASGYQTDQSGQQNPYYSQYTTATGNGSGSSEQHRAADTQTTGITPYSQYPSVGNSQNHHQPTDQSQMSSSVAHVDQQHQLQQPQQQQYQSDGGYYYSPYGYQAAVGSMQSQLMNQQTDVGYTTYSPYGQQQQNNQIPPMNPTSSSTMMMASDGTVVDQQQQYSQVAQQPTGSNYYEYGGAGAVGMSTIPQQFSTNPMTYMNSNNNGGTVTTSSDNYCNSTTSSTSEVLPAPVNIPQEQPPPTPQIQPVVQPKAAALPAVVAATPTPKPRAKPPNSNIDLLLGIDFTGSPLPETLQPVIVGGDTGDDNKSDILAPVPVAINPIPEPLIPKTSVAFVDPAVIDRVRDFVLNEKLPASFDRKSSADNLSVCSDLSSLDQNFDWDSASARNDDAAISVLNKINALASGGGGTRTDPLEDGKIVKIFHKEVERFERFMESLNVKTLNGTTAMDGKWKEIQDLLVSVSWTFVVYFY